MDGELYRDDAVHFCNCLGYSVFRAVALDLYCKCCRCVGLVLQMQMEHVQISKLFLIGHVEKQSYFWSSINAHVTANGYSLALLGS
jgi:hypothetical protein